MAGGLRERRRKRGRKPAKLKRQGYHTDWRKPKLFTLYLLDEQRQLVKPFAPVHDATLGDHEALFINQRVTDALPASPAWLKAA